MMRLYLVGTPPLGRPVVAARRPYHGSQDPHFHAAAYLKILSKSSCARV